MGLAARSFTDADYVAALEKAGLVGIAIEKLPRKLSSAQSMDEMTSQNSVMGYKAAITAAELTVPSADVTTAAGTIRRLRRWCSVPASPAAGHRYAEASWRGRHRVRRASRLPGRGRVPRREVP